MLGLESWCWSRKLPTVYVATEYFSKAVRCMQSDNSLTSLAMQWDALYRHVCSASTMHISTPKSTLGDGYCMWNVYTRWSAPWHCSHQLCRMIYHIFWYLNGFCRTSHSASSWLSHESICSLHDTTQLFWVYSNVLSRTKHWQRRTRTYRTPK